MTMIITNKQFKPKFVQKVHSSQVGNPTRAPVE